MRKGWRRRAVLSAQSLIGDEVRNLENQMLGRIEDIMIDVPTGRVAYAVLSFGGIMGMGDKLFALPWQGLRVDDRRRQVIVDVDKTHLRQAPGFDKNDWPDMADLSWSNRVHGFWMGRDGDVLHRRVMSAGTLPVTRSEIMPAKTLARSRRPWSIWPTAGRLCRAGVRRHPWVRHPLFAVPWRALRLNEDEKRFVLDADRERLENLPGFDKNNWPDMADPAWSSRVEMQFAR